MFLSLSRNDIMITALDLAIYAQEYTIHTKACLSTKIYIRFLKNRS